MNYIFLMFVFLVVAEAKIQKENQFFDDYISPKTTNAINGIFVLFVLLRHFSQYKMINKDSYSNVAFTLNSYLGQLIVVTFLFYSGYGIFESLKKKGKVYVKKLPIRFLKVWMHFAIAVSLFAIMKIYLHKPLELKTFLWSVVGWEAIGNSNWYICVVLMLYIITFISLLFIPKRKEKELYFINAFILTIFSIILVIILVKLKGKGKIYWANTILCYSAGAWYSLLKDKIEKVVCRNELTYFLSLVLVAFAFIGCRDLKKTLVYYELYAICFAFLVVLLSMKVKVDNGFLQFLGNHTFSIYILQRLPMIYVVNKCNYKSHPYFYFLMIFLITIILAIMFDYMMKKLDVLIFKEKNQKTDKSIPGGKQ